MTARRALSVDQYLHILRTNPVPLDRVLPDSAVNQTFAAMTRAVAAFMDACRAEEEKGYAWGRDVLESMTHMFPIAPDPDDNGAVQHMGGNTYALDLRKATDDQLRDFAKRSLTGYTFEHLKAMQARVRAVMAAQAAANPAPPAPEGGTDWRALEAQFNETEDDKP